MKYSIIIPTYNHCEDLLKPCLESIKKYTDLSDTEVIVVSNGSTDNTREYVKSLGKPFKFLWFLKPLGYAKANNEGVKIAKGKYVVLLNNDTILLEQEQSQWLKILEQPFIDDPSVGIVGPLKQFSEPAGRDFLVFFVAMVTKELFDKLQLSEDYTPGGGEDTEFCIEAEKLGYKIFYCATSTNIDADKKLVAGDFPIYHKGEGTMNDNPEWQKIFDENSLKLAKKYNPGYYAFKLSNNFERAVLGSGDKLEANTREHARYTFAAEHLVGKKVLEIGCSSGYGLSFLPSDIEYTGIDYDSKIIEFAKEHFGGINRTFICVDAHKFEFKEHYDTIIAFEFIEHIDDGIAFAQKLKKHCDNLLITTPFKETPGFWGGHHKLHGLSEKDFPGFDYFYLNGEGKFIDKPDHFDGQNLLVMQWGKGKIYPKFEAKPRILCSIATKDRYDILSSCLMSVALQTHAPDMVTIFDDGEQKDLRELPIYKHIFKLFDLKGIKWSVTFTPKKGQHYAHALANDSDYDFIWRLDDDEIAESDVLEKLLGHMTDKVGAVAGAVFEPGSPLPGGSSNIKDIFHKPNIQWAPGQGIHKVEHLYSSFLYRPGIVQYNLDLSPVAHREETLFSHELKQKGYELIVDTSIKTYHFRHETGGIRSHDSQFFYDHDNKIFLKQMETWGYKVINLDLGLGDHFVFLHILPEIMKKYKLILGCCYPEVFEDYDVTILPIAITQTLVSEHVYKWMIDHNWKTSILDAFKQMYGVN